MADKQKIKIISYRGKDAPPVDLSPLKNQIEELKGNISSWKDSQEQANGVMDGSIADLENKLSEVIVELDRVKEYDISSLNLLVESLNSKFVSYSTKTELGGLEDKIQRNILDIIDLLKANKTEIDKVRSEIPTIVSDSDNVTVEKRGSEYGISVDIPKLKQIVQGGGISKTTVQSMIDKSLIGYTPGGVAISGDFVTRSEVADISSGLQTQIDNIPLGNYVLKTGDTMTGDLIMDNAQISTDQIYYSGTTLTLGGSTFIFDWGSGYVQFSNTGINHNQYGDVAFTSAFNDYFTKIEVVEISSNLQSKIDNIIQEGTTIIGGPGITASQNGMTWTVGLSGTFGDANLRIEVGNVTGYLQSQLDALDSKFVNVSGDTMTGPLTITEIKAVNVQGLNLKNSNGQSVAMLGAGGGQGITFYDGVIVTSLSGHTDHFVTHDSNGRLTDSDISPTSILQLSGNVVSQATQISQLSGNSISQAGQIASISASLSSSLITTPNTVAPSSLYLVLSNKNDNTAATTYSTSGLFINPSTNLLTVPGITSPKGNPSLLNEAYGPNTLKNITYGVANIAIGAEALSAAQGASQCIAIGYQSCRDQVNGGTNIGIGNYTNKINQMNSNVAIGNAALMSNTVGTGNLAIGENAGTTNISGSYNVIIGNNSYALDARNSNKLSIYAGSSMGTSANALIFGDFSNGTLFNVGNRILHQGNIRVSPAIIELSGNSISQATQIAQLSGNSISQSTQITSISAQSSQLTAISGQWVKDTGDTIRGILLFDNSSNAENGVQFESGNLFPYSIVGQLSQLKYVTDLDVPHNFRIGQNTIFSIASSGASISGNKVWHAGNDGSSSSLDADLLDGQHGSYYISQSAAMSANALIQATNSISGGSSFPACIHMRSSNAGQSLTVSRNIIVYEDLDYSTGGGSWATSGAFYVPSAGYYHVSATITPDAVSSATLFSTYIYVNGNEYKSEQWREQAATSDLRTFDVEGVVYCAAGDYIRILFYTSIGYNMYADSNYNRLAIHKVG